MENKLITKKEFEDAEKVIINYNKQINKSLVKNRVCICCKKNELKPFMSLSEGFIKPSEQNTGNWDGGTVELISFGYGSRNDLSRFFIAICDDCIEQLESEGLATDFKKVITEERVFYESKMY